MKWISVKDKLPKEAGHYQKRQRSQMTIEPCATCTICGTEKEAMFAAHRFFNTIIIMCSEMCFKRYFDMDRLKPMPVRCYTCLKDVSSFKVSLIANRCQIAFCSEECAKNCDDTIAQNDSKK